MAFCTLSNRDGIYTLTLGNGDKHHYLAAEAIAEVKAALESIRGAGAKARGLVTTSSWGSFCDGLNFQVPASHERLEYGMAEVVQLLLDLPMPTAAAVCGDAKSLGFVLALAHDHCIMHKKGVVVGFPEGRHRRRVPDYAVALVRDKIANLQLRKLLLLKSHMCTGEEFAGTWFSVQDAADHWTLVSAAAVHLLERAVVGEGVDYAKVRRTMYTQSCKAVAVTIRTGTAIFLWESSGSRTTEINHSSAGPVNISLADIVSCTGDFSPAQKIGTGGYADVYKGVYRGEDIAFKKLNVAGLDENQFKNEVMHLMTVRHSNIVRFVGYCSEIKQTFLEKDDLTAAPTKRTVLVYGEYIYRILCFEYCPGGSLKEHLADESSGFDWRTRYKIIKGIAEGLKYLHELKPAILHLDLKPGNVLLDKNNVPKISDFGISRLFTDNRTHVTKSENIKGTKKYMAPEYMDGGVISHTNDLFSFGIMVIQIIAGENSYMKLNHEEQPDHFIDLVCAKWKTRMMEASQYQTAELYQVKICIELAIECTHKDRKRRPDTASIVDRLNQTEIVVENVQK